MSDYRTFVVPYDFSEHARAALHTAADLARRLGADVHLLHVVQPPLYAFGYPGEAVVPAVAVDMVEVRKSAAESLARVAAEVTAELAAEGMSGRLEPHVYEGVQIADTLCDAADRLGADLLVMGTHGRTGLAHVFLGSVAERTLRRSRCPVLVVPLPHQEGDGS